MKTVSLTALEAAKLRRTELTTAVAAAVSPAAAELNVARAEVDKLADARAGFVAACRIDDVIATDERLLKAQTAVEVFTRKAEAEAELHTALVTELRQAEAAVHALATEIREAETIAKAERLEQMADELLRAGRELQMFIGSELNRPLNVAARVLPPQIERALSRVPVPDAIHVSASQLRGIFGSTDAWDRRLAELMADDPEPQAEAVAVAA